MLLVTWHPSCPFPFLHMPLILAHAFLAHFAARLPDGPLEPPGKPVPNGLLSALLDAQNHRWRIVEEAVGV